MQTNTKREYQQPKIVVLSTCLDTAVTKGPDKSEDAAGGMGMDNQNRS
jgi:hypothetical protein